MSDRNPNRRVVEQHFIEYCESEYPGDPVDKVFERYAVTQVLKPRELPSDDLIDGIVDGDRDGGIDSFFVFLNGALLAVDSPLLEPGGEAIRRLPAKPELAVYLIQAKNKESWEEATWDRLLSSLDKLLDAEADDADLDRLFRPAVVERTKIFRAAMRSLGTKFPRVIFHAFYVTKADERNLVETIQNKSEQVRALISSRLTANAEVRVDHVGLDRLYDLAGTEYNSPAILKFRDLIRETDSFLGVVEVQDYLSFIRDVDSGRLREELFDSNVRDFEGSNTVNEAIAETLTETDGAEFWWLNNGVTVIGDQVDSPQKTLTISQPLIVNGLQTSYVLDQADRDGHLAAERRSDGVVVRVIVSTDEDTRDRVIAGTNRQTPVAGPALFATQPFQRDIERYFRTAGLFYERRKNRYKNQGVPAKKRVTMSLLAQAVITLMLDQPDGARARPSTLLNNKEGYDRLFPETLTAEPYLIGIKLLKSVDEFLKTDIAKEILDEFTNSRFYVLAGYARLKLKIKPGTGLNFEKNFSRLKAEPDQKLLIKALTKIANCADEFQMSNRKTSRDAIFKNSEFRRTYFEELQK